MPRRFNGSSAPGVGGIDTLFIAFDRGPIDPEYSRILLSNRWCCRYHPFTIHRLQVKTTKSTAGGPGFRVGSRHPWWLPDCTEVLRQFRSRRVEKPLVCLVLCVFAPGEKCHKKMDLNRAAKLPVESACYLSHRIDQPLCALSSPRLWYRLVRYKGKFYEFCCESPSFWPGF